MYYRAHAGGEGFSPPHVGTQRGGRGVPLEAHGVVRGGGDGTACDNLGEVRSFEGEVHLIHSVHSCQRMGGEDRSLVGCWEA